MAPPAFRGTRPATTSSSAPLTRGANSARDVSRTFVENLLTIHSSALTTDIASALRTLLFDNLMVSSEADLLDITPSILRRYAGNNVSPIRVERVMRFLSHTLQHPHFHKMPTTRTPAVSAMPSPLSNRPNTLVSSISRPRPKPTRNRTSFTLSHELMPKFSTDTPNRDGRVTQLTGSRARSVPSA